ncbi:unnamed protein product, partial [Effrenium voratum]
KTTCRAAPMARLQQLVDLFSCSNRTANMAWRTLALHFPARAKLDKAGCLKSGGLLLQGSHRGCRRHQDSPETGGLYRPGQGAKALDRAGLKDGPEICRFAPAIMLLLLAVHKMEVWLWPCQLHCSRGRSEEKSLHARPNDEFALQLRARMQQD